MRFLLCDFCRKYCVYLSVFLSQGFITRRHSWPHTALSRADHCVGVRVKGGGWGGMRTPSPKGRGCVASRCVTHRAIPRTGALAEAWEFTHPLLPKSKSPRLTPSSYFFFFLVFCGADANASMAFSLYSRPTQSQGCLLHRISPAGPCTGFFSRELASLFPCSLLVAAPCALPRSWL